VLNLKLKDIKKSSRKVWMTQAGAWWWTRWAPF